MKQQPRNEHLPFPETFPKEKMLSQSKGMKQFCFRSIYFGNLLSRRLSISRRPPPLYPQIKHPSHQKPLKVYTDAPQIQLINILTERATIIPPSPPPPLTNPSLKSQAS
jgi:hypothetical protein